MARLTGSLVWVSVLVVLSVGVSLGNDNPLANFLQNSSEKRIISKQNPNLSLTIRGGIVVLARTNFSDRSQVWIQDVQNIGTLGTDDECRKPFALVNFNPSTFSALAIIPSNDGSRPVKLAPYKPLQCVQLSMLWTKSTPVSNFSAIRLFRDESMGFNGLGGSGKEGTVIGVLPTDGVNPNVQ